MLGTDEVGSVRTGQTQRAERTGHRTLTALQPYFRNSAAVTAIADGFTISTLPSAKIRNSEICTARDGNEESCPVPPSHLHPSANRCRADGQVPTT